MNNTKSIAIGLLAVAVILIGVGWWFFQSYNAPASSGSQSDIALLNKIKTSAEANVTDFLADEKSIAQNLFDKDQYRNLVEVPVTIDTSGVGNSRPFAPLSYIFE